MTCQNLISIKPLLLNDFEGKDVPEVNPQAMDKFEKAFRCIDSENKGNITTNQLMEFLNGYRKDGSIAQHKWSIAEINLLMFRFSSSGGENWNTTDFTNFMKTKFL